jgi:N-acetylglutamate synthase
MNALRFTSMTVEDIPDVLAFWRTMEGVGLHASDSPEVPTRFLERNPGWSLVVRDSTGRVVAAVLCGHDGRRGYLHHLATAPDLRRRGLGTQLVERCLVALAGQSIPKCNVFVYDNNQLGLPFWLNLGFRKRELIVLQRPTEREGRSNSVTAAAGPG